MTAPIKTHKEKKPEISYRNFSVRSETWNEKDRSFEAVLTTEWPAPMFDYDSWKVCDEILLMTGVVIPKAGQVPLLDTHDRTTVRKQVGSCREIRPEGERLLGRNYISSVETEIAVKIAEKHITDCSVGYIVDSYVNIEAGKSADVNGKTFTAKGRNLHVVTSWRLKENSICPIGLDEDAKIKEYKEDEKVENDLKPAAPVQTPAAEPISAPPPAKAVDPDAERKAGIYAITPRGYESLAEECVIKGKSVAEAKEIFLAELEKKMKPVGTGEPAAPKQIAAGAVPKPGDLDDQTFVNSITGF